MLTAPVKGIIKGITVHTLGAVVESGEVLMEVVPVDEELIVEAMVLPNDIGNVHEGQKVEIKVSAFDFSRYGSVSGILKNVSASTFQNKDGNSFYKARISLAQNYVGKDNKHNLILPGMTVQANIITGQKTILQYLLKPIQNATEGAFHER
jgi:HlyD family secretion protein/adhesin transport system membrane fusion protein